MEVDADGNDHHNGQNGSGEGQESEDGEPSDQPGEGEGEGEGDSKSDSEQEGDEDQQASSAGGKYDAANQIIDGETFYRDVFGQYDDQMKEEMSSDDDVPEDIRDIVENYFEIIG